MKNIEEVNEDPEFREYMSAEEDARKIRNSELKESYDKGIKKGVEKGSLNRTREIAKEMLTKEIDINLIAEVTKLSIKEIKNIPL